MRWGPAPEYERMWDEVEAAMADERAAEEAAAAEAAAAAALARSDTGGKLRLLLGGKGPRAAFRWVARVRPAPLARLRGQAPLARLRRFHSRLPSGSWEICHPQAALSFVLPPPLPSPPPPPLPPLSCEPHHACPPPPTATPPLPRYQGDAAEDEPEGASGGPGSRSRPVSSPGVVVGAALRRIARMLGSSTGASGSSVAPAPQQHG